MSFDPPCIECNIECGFFCGRCNFKSFFCCLHNFIGNFRFFQFILFGFAKKQGVCTEIFDKKAGSAKEYLTENFAEKDTFLFICATGITVRLIAPLIRGKDRDPAVVVMDEAGRYVIPLLSGHLGGANRAALQLAELLHAEPVVTTATDINGKFAVDVWSGDAGCVIKDVSGIRKVSSAVLEGKKIGLRSSFPIEGAIPAELTEGPAEIGICVSLSGKGQPYAETFHVVPRIVTLGTGCRKGVSSHTFEDFILSQLAENHIDISAIEQICSIDLKKKRKMYPGLQRKVRDSLCHLYRRGASACLRGFFPF